LFFIFSIFSSKKIKYNGKKTPQKKMIQYGGVTPFRMQKVKGTCPILQFKQPNNCVASSYRILGIANRKQSAELSRKSHDGIAEVVTIELLNSLFPGSDYTQVKFHNNETSKALAEPFLLQMLDETSENMTTGLLGGVSYKSGGSHSITFMKNSGKVHIVDNQTNGIKVFTKYMNPSISYFDVSIDINSEIFQHFAASHPAQMDAINEVADFRNIKITEGWNAERDDESQNIKLFKDIMSKHATGEASEDECEEYVHIYTDTILKTELYEKYILSCRELLDRFQTVQYLKEGGFMTEYARECNKWYKLFLKKLSNPEKSANGFSSRKENSPDTGNTLKITKKKQKELHQTALRSLEELSCHDGILKYQKLHSIIVDKLSELSDIHDDLPTELTSENVNSTIRLLNRTRKPSLSSPNSSSSSSSKRRRHKSAISPFMPFLSKYTKKSKSSSS